MNRFARVLVVAMTAAVLTAAVVSVSAAGTGKSGTTVSVQKQQSLSAGHLRPVGEAAAQGDSGEFFGQWFDWGRFYTYLFWYSKVYYKS